MIESLKKLLSPVATAGKAPPPDLRVATCALLLEVAEVDQDFAPEERAVIESMLQRRFDLEPEEVAQLIAETEAARAGATDLWPFTTAIRQAYTPDQKRELLVMVWRVIFADGRLDPYEDQLAHRFERLLAVNHSLLIEAKLLAREEGTGET